MSGNITNEFSPKLTSKYKEGLLIYCFVYTHVLFCVVDNFPASPSLLYLVTKR